MRLYQVFINHKTNVNETSSINSGIILLNRNTWGQYMLEVEKNAKFQFLNYLILSSSEIHTKFLESYNKGNKVMDFYDEVPYKYWVYEKCSIIKAMIFKLNFCNEANAQNCIQEIKKGEIDLYYFSNTFECISLYRYH